MKRTYLAWIGGVLLMVLVGVLILFLSSPSSRFVRDDAAAWFRMPEEEHVLESHIIEPRVRLCRTLADNSTMSFSVARSHTPVYVNRGACVGECPCDPNHPIAVDDAMYCPAPYSMMCDCGTETTVCGNESARLLFSAESMQDGECPC